MDSVDSILLNLMKCNTFLYCNNRSCYDNCASIISNLFSELGFQIDLIDTSVGKIIIGKHIIDTQYSHVHFNGHYDVVPPANNARIGYQEKESTFWGRGCSDMKGGIVAVWIACKNAIEQKISINLSFSFSPDEETGGIVASKKIPANLLEFLPKNSMIIIADSSYPNIITSHRGALWVEIAITLDSKKRFEKKAISAFEIMCHYYLDFMKTCSNSDIVIGGNCQTSNAVNVWAHTAVFSLDYRFDAPLTLNEQEKWTQNHLNELNKKMQSEFSFDFNPLLWKILLAVEPCTTIGDFDNVLHIARKTIPEANLEKGKGFYDLRYFRNEGYKNSFVLGPGDIFYAHVKEEKLKKDNILDCAKVYLGLIERIKYDNF